MNLFIKPENFFKDIINILIEENFKEKDIYDIILVGSRLYRCHNKDSDYDVIVINKNITGQTLNKSIYNITCFTKESFQESLDNQKMVALEVFFAEHLTYKYKNIPFKYVLNKKLLIENTTKNIEETISKSKKLFTENPKLAKKKIFHAIKVNAFKEQILSNDKIYNFTEYNELFNNFKYSYDTIDNIINDLNDFLI